MPNVVSQVSEGKARGWQKVDYLENVERVETVDCVRSHAEEVGKTIRETFTRRQSSLLAS
jgi:hypothetical protein